MSYSNEIFSPNNDNGGRRLGITRRHFSYTMYIPERRCNKDRRIGQDRRSGQDRRDDEVMCIRMDSDQRSGKDLRSGRDRRIAFLDQPRAPRAMSITAGGPLLPSSARRAGHEIRDEI